MWENPARADAPDWPVTSLVIEIPSTQEGDSALLCHVAADDEGVCWSFTDVRSVTPVPPPLAAFRRAAAPGAKAASFDASGLRISHETFTAIAAKQIVHGIGPSRVRPAAGMVTFLDRRTLGTSTHNVTVHPFDVPAKPQTRDEFLRDLLGLQNGSPFCRQELTGRWQRLSDKRFGAFADLDDSNFRQLPLKVSLARISDPCSLLPAPPAVVGVGIDPESARVRAIVQALVTYGSIVVDPRLLVDENGAFLGPREGDATRLLGSVRGGSVDAFVRAVGLTDGRERLLPVQLAFPVLRTPQPTRAPCGASAALGWRQALTHGLIQHCVRLTVSDSSFQTRKASCSVSRGLRPRLRCAISCRNGESCRHRPHPARHHRTCRDPGRGVCIEFGEYGLRRGVHLVEAVREALTAALFCYQLRCDPVLKAAIPTGASAFGRIRANSALRTQTGW